MSKFLASPLASHLLRMANDPAVHAALRRTGHHGFEFGKSVFELVVLARSPR